MQTDEKGWNDCTHVFHPSGAKYQPLRKRNDFWNDLQDAAFKQPFQVERLAQEDSTFGVFLGERCYTVPFHLFSYRGAVERFRPPIWPPRDALEQPGVHRCRRRCVLPGDGGGGEKIEVGRLPRTRIRSPSMRGFVAS
jgi:hypothetical protein